MTRNRTNNPLNPHVNKHPQTSSNYPYRNQNITVTRNSNPITNETPESSTQTNEASIDNNLNKKLKNLKIISWNANGLTNKRSELRTLIEDEKPDIVAICEAKMDSVTVNLLYEFNDIGFFPYHKLRNKDGGGVVLLVKKTIKNCKKLELTEDEEAIYGLNELEMIGIRIKLENKHYNVVCNYVPPEKKVSKKLFDYLEKNGNYILVGDFNAKLAAYNIKTNASGNKLQEILDETSCHVINERYQPTYIRKATGQRTYKSTLDLVIVSNNIEQMKRKIETLPHSAVSKHQDKWYHIPVSVEFKIKVAKKHIRKSHTSSFLYDKANWNEYYNKLDQNLIDVDTESTNYSDLSKKISSAIKNAADQSIPKSKPPNNNRKLNYPIHIQNLIVEKRRLNHIYNLNNNQNNGENLRNAQIECGDAISVFHQSKWHDFIKKMGPHPLSTIPFWRRINRLHSQPQQKNVADLNVEGVTITTNEGKAKVLADRLENIFTNDENDKFSKDKFDEVENKLANEGVDSFYAQTERQTKPFSMEEMSRAIKKLNRKTSTDQDSISNRLIRQARHSRIAMECMLALFNKCIIEKQVPEYWKMSTVTMLHKKDSDPAQPKSYRPISITPCLARLYERLILARLKKFLRQHKVIIKQQSGFREHRQTKDNIAFLTQKVQQGFMEKKKTLGIFFDVASAFDKVWHNGLLFKLATLKVPYEIVKAIEALLRNRKFQVKVGEIFSTIRNINCGVPQGAVLSPTLFSIYINDLPIRNKTGLGKENHEFSMLFADDICYLLTFKDGIQAKLIAQEYLLSLEAWMNTWRLSLAPHKCAQIVFSRARKFDITELDLSLYGIKIPKESNPKFLGVVFDRRLNFEAQINHIRTKTSERISILKILSFDKFWSLNKILLIKLYKSLVRSVIEYSSTIIDSISPSFLKKLEAIQNNSLRAIFQMNWEEKIPVEELRRKAKVESIKERLKKLNELYIEKALVSNPFIEQLIDDYLDFKNRGKIDPSKALGDQQMILEINMHNIEQENQPKTHETLLCHIKTIDEMRSDRLPP
jgi:hypothetical protein